LDRGIGRIRKIRDRGNEEMSTNRRREINEGGKKGGHRREKRLKNSTVVRFDRRRDEL